MSGQYVTAAAARPRITASGSQRVTAAILVTGSSAWPGSVKTPGSTRVSRPFTQALVRESSSPGCSRRRMTCSVASRCSITSSCFTTGACGRRPTSTGAAENLWTELEGVTSLWMTPPRGEVTPPGPRRARHAAESSTRGPFDAPRRQAQSSGAMSTLTSILDFFASVKITPLTGVHVRVVATPGHGGVGGVDQPVVGRVEVQPAGAGDPAADPGVRRVRAHQPRLARRRPGGQVAADVPPGQAQDCAARRP